MNPLLLLFVFLTAADSFTPRLSLIPKWESGAFHDDSFNANDLDVKSFTTFPQKYFINFKFWGGANSSAPIFVFFGGEAPIDDAPKTIGLMTDNAAFFDALLVYIEHRYYGESVPFGSWEEATKNASTMGYFNSAQAIADYAEVILHIKETLHAKMSPVIVLGGSYSGMLAAWFRLKYPHLAIGALASSAPILYVDDIIPRSGYYDVVTRDFREASETCYETIKNSWYEIDRIASQPNGLSILSQLFNTCYPLMDSTELKNSLRTLYSRAAQYDAPPKYPVTVFCRALDKISDGSGILRKIGAGIASLGNDTCKINGPSFAGVQTNVGWGWQTCTDIVMPLGIGNDTMFQPDPFNLELYAKGCKERYGVPPRPHWVTTYFGGHGIKLVLQRFGSNIIFSNGLRDPFSSGGVLNDISSNIVAINTDKGSHCLDIFHAKKSDPKWLIQQRKKEIKIIKGWINQYNADFLGVHSSKAAQKYSIKYSRCIMTAWIVWWIFYGLYWDMLV